MIQIVLWRLSLVVAALLVALSLWWAYELLQEALFWDAIAGFLGVAGAMKWENVAALLVLVGLLGVVLPGLYVRWGWVRAFPRGSTRSHH